MRKLLAFIALLLLTALAFASPAFAGSGTVQYTPCSSGCAPFATTTDGSSNNYGRVTLWDYSAAANGQSVDSNHGAVVAGEGTAGTATGGVLTVQGVASMTPLLTNPGTAANWGVGATGSSVPANAGYTGLNNGGSTIGWIGDSSGRGIVAGAGTAGTPAGGVLSIQGVSSGTNLPVSQATAASLNATVVGTGTFAVQATLQASATTAIGKVDPNTIGSWGLQVSTQNSATPTNGQMVLGQFNTTPTTITSGNVSPFQLDSAGNLLTNVKTSALPTGAATSANQATNGATTAHTCSTGGFSELGCLGQIDDDVKGSIAAGTNAIGFVNVGTYNTIAASQTAQALTGGSGGATGDYLSHCVVIPTSTSPGVVTIKDSSTTVYAFPGGSSSLSNLVPFSIPVGAKSVSGAWTVTTGASLSAVCVGKFT